MSFDVKFTGYTTRVGVHSATCGESLYDNANFNVKYGSTGCEFESSLTCTSNRTRFPITTTTNWRNIKFVKQGNSISFYQDNVLSKTDSGFTWLDVNA